MTEVRLAEIERLVSGKVLESVVLEYKASPALARDPRKIAELRKDISAFANADGGRLVYGIEAKNGVPVGIDDGVDPKVITVDWIHDVMAGGIRPRLDGVRITSLPRGSAGRVLFVIDVPRSTTAHMANHSYFKRSGSAAVPMEDYEVRDVMARREQPDVRVRFIGHPAGKELEIEIQVRNLADAPAPYFMVDLFTPPGVHVVRFGGRFSGRLLKGQPRLIHFDKFSESFTEWRYQWWDQMPLFSGDSEIVGTFTIATVHGKHVLWAVSGPSMRRQGGYITTSEGASALRPVEAQWEMERPDPAEG